MFAYRPLRSNVLLGNSALLAVRAAAPRDLAPYLLEFWQYEVPEPLSYVPVQIYPSGVSVLRFDIRPDGVDATLFGPSLSPNLRGLFFRGVPIFGVAVRATHTYQLLGLSASELRELRIALDVFWPRALPELKQRLWHAADFAQRVAILSEFLRGVLRTRAPDPEFLGAFQALVESGGRLPLAAKSGASERTMRRQFARFVGVSPKEMARVIRFQRLLSNMVQAVPGDLARIAQQAGYSDQAHMTREFVRMVGVAPGEYLRYLPRLHDPRLEIWSRLSPEDGPPGEQVGKAGSRLPDFTSML